MKKYTYIMLLALLGSAQNMWGAAAQAQKLISAGAKLLWTGTVAGTTCYFAPTIKAAAEQYLKPSTEQTLAETLSRLVQQPAAPTVTPEQIAAVVRDALTASGNATQPAEYGWSYIGPVLSLMANHKVLTGLIGTIGIGATVYASHEGTRKIVRERFAALGTALERLKEQLMARMNGIEQQITQGTDALGNALNESEERNTERFNQLAQFIAATAAAQQNNLQMPATPVFSAQPVFIAPAAPLQHANTAPLMDAEPRGWFTTVRGWFGA